MIICLGATPAVQRVMIFGGLAIGGVNRAAEVMEGAAGKGVNVAKVLRVLGREVLATGLAGGDRGQFLRSELDRAGVWHDFVTVGPKTRLCVTLVDRGAGTHTELVEESRAVEGGAYEGLLGKLRGQLGRARLLTMSGTLTPGAPADFYGRCTAAAAEAGVPVVLDATGEALRQALGARPAVVKPNRAELGATLGTAVSSEAEVAAGMRRMLELGAQAVVVTLGAEGAMATDGRRWWRIRVPAVAVVNSIGSGDAFTAGLAAGLADGMDLGEAGRLGAACGAANALTLLAGEVRAEDVERIKGEVSCQLGVAG